MLENQVHYFGAIASPVQSHLGPIKTDVAAPKAQAHPAPDTGGAASGLLEPSELPRVLVVEDVFEVAESLEKTLQSWGYAARFCTSAYEALAMAPYYEPHVVLIDIGLPDLNGWDLARKLREQNLAVDPLMIAITAYGEQTDFKRSEQAGISFHLVKPAYYTQLRELLERIGAPATKLSPPTSSTEEIEKQVDRISYNAAQLAPESQRAFIIAACRDLRVAGMEGEAVREIERRARENLGQA